MSEKELPKIEINPIEEGRLSRKRGLRVKDKVKKKLNPIPPTTGVGNLPNKSIEKAHKIREIDIANFIYQMMLDGKSEQDIMRELDVTQKVVRKYLDMKLQDVQDGLIALRGKFSVIGYERIERYVIAPAIQEIQKMLAEGHYEPRPYETLMKGIKLQAELIAPKTTVNINSNSGDIFMSNGGAMYNEIVDMMRNDEAYDPPFTIESENVELNTLRIENVENDS